MQPSPRISTSIQHPEPSPKAEQTVRPCLKAEPHPGERRWQEKTALDHPYCFWHGEAENICPSSNAENICTMSSVVFTALSGDEHQHPWGWGRGRTDANITSPRAPQQDMEPSVFASCSDFCRRKILASHTQDSRRSQGRLVPSHWNNLCSLESV